MRIFQRILRYLCILFGCVGIITSCKDSKRQEEIMADPLIPSAGSYTGMPDLNKNLEKIQNLENPLHKNLIGTKWKFEEFDIDFAGIDKLIIKGGIVRKISPEGIVADYKVYDDGVIEIMVMGMIKTGMWDGKKLVIDGLIGTRSN